MIGAVFRHLNAASMIRIPAHLREDQGLACLHFRKEVRKRLPIQPGVAGRGVGHQRQPRITRLAARDVAAHATGLRHRPRYQFIENIPRGSQAQAPEVCAGKVRQMANGAFQQAHGDYGLFGYHLQLPLACAVPERTLEVATASFQIPRGIGSGVARR